MGVHFKKKRMLNRVVNILAYPFFLVAITYAFYQLYSIRNSNIELKQRISVKDNYLSNLEELKSKLVTFESLSYKLNNTLINNTFVYDISNDICFLKELLDSPKIILHYSELTCMDCVDQEVKNLKSLNEQIGNENIVILASYYNKRDLFVFKRVNGLVDNLVFNIKENATGMVTDSLNIPVIMVLDSSLVVRESFIPDIDFPERSKKYYNTIINKYFLM